MDKRLSEWTIRIFVWFADRERSSAYELHNRDYTNQTKFPFRLGYDNWAIRSYCFSAHSISVWPPFPKHFTYNPALFSIVAYVRVPYTEVTYKSADMMYVPDTVPSQAVQFNVFPYHVDTGVAILINRYTRPENVPVYTANVDPCYLRILRLIGSYCKFQFAFGNMGGLINYRV